jgi:hypothetical protein
LGNLGRKKGCWIIKNFNVPEDLVNEENEHKSKSESRVSKDRHAMHVGHMLYRDNPQSFKQNEDDDSADSFNKRLRDLEVEMSQNEQSKAQEDYHYEDIDVDTASYKRNQELGFDPLTHEVETKIEIQELGEPSDITEEDVQSEGKARGRKRKKSTFLNTLRLGLITQALKKTLENINRTTSKVIDSISTYRHHSINAPGSQAGIFDNTVEANKEAFVRETIVKAAVARHFLEGGLDVLQRAQDAATQRMADVKGHPYAAQFEQVADVARAMKNSVDPMLSSQEQNVNKQKLGALDLDVVPGAAGMNIAGNKPLGR